MISLSFKISTSDMLAFFRFLQERSPMVQASLRRGQFTFPGIMLLGLCYAIWRSSELLAVFYIGLAVAWHFFYPRLFWRRVTTATTKLLQEPSYQRIFGDLTLKLDDSGISSTSPIGESHFKWDAVENVFLTPIHLYIVLHGKQGYVVPRDQVGEERIQAAKSLVESKITQNGQTESATQDPSEAPASPSATPVRSSD